MKEVDIAYFGHRYNPKNKRTVVTNIDNIEAVGFIIKLGEGDDKCDVCVKADPVAVINKIKPTVVMVSEKDDTICNFCDQIGIPWEIPNFDYNEVEEIDEGVTLEDLENLEEEKDDEEEFEDFISQLEEVIPKEDLEKMAKECPSAPEWYDGEDDNLFTTTDDISGE